MGLEPMTTEYLATFLSTVVNFLAYCMTQQMKQVQKLSASLQHLGFLLAIINSYKIYNNLQIEMATFCYLLRELLSRPGA